ncbi:MAG: purine-binding chemotaxis protein CheW [Acidobacteria bacterium]|nr:purine-binding chemotaxis protein CheW [Acidobacteriota bacterium]
MRGHRVRPEAINWEDIRGRLGRAGAALAGALERTPEERRRVMDERARVLARVPAISRPDEEKVEIVTMVLGAEHYAVETKHVREIARLVDFTPVPGTPDFVLGIANLRGEIVAVMDLRRFFGVPVKGLTDLSRVVVLGTTRSELGVLVDEAQAVMSLRAEEVLEPPGSVAGIGRDYLRGVTADALIILDGAVLLKDSRVFVNQAEGGVE